MSTPYEALSTTARELVLFAENTHELYAQKCGIARNLARKIAKGTYDAAKAPKLWRYWTDAAAKMYSKGYDGVIFTPADRQEAAEYFAITEYDSIVNGEYAGTPQQIDLDEPPF